MNQPNQNGQQPARAISAADALVRQRQQAAAAAAANVFDLENALATTIAERDAALNERDAAGVALRMLREDMQALKAHYSEEAVRREAHFNELIERLTQERDFYKVDNVQIHADLDVAARALLAAVQRKPRERDITDYAPTSASRLTAAVAEADRQAEPHDPPPPLPAGQ